MQKVPELEYVPLPEGTTAPCLVPMPPLNAEGLLEYTAILPYVVEVLGILEECNIKLSEIKKLQGEVISGREEDN